MGRLLCDKRIGIFSGHASQRGGLGSCGNVNARQAEATAEEEECEIYRVKRSSEEVLGMVGAGGRCTGRCPFEIRRSSGDRPAVGVGGAPPVVGRAMMKSMKNSGPLQVSVLVFGFGEVFSVVGCGRKPEDKPCKPHLTNNVGHLQYMLACAVGVVSAGSRSGFYQSEDLHFAGLTSSLVLELCRLFVRHIISLGLRARTHIDLNAFSCSYFICTRLAHTLI